MIQGRLVLADDHAMLREGLSRSLVAHGYEVVGEAGNGARAVELVDHHHPDAVLLDVSMPVLDGIGAVIRMTERGLSVPALLLTMHTDTALVVRARAAGALGYLTKDCSTADIVAAIERARQGETTFPFAATTANDRPLISGREAEVLQLVADGKTTSEIAETLFVSVKTVKNHLASAYARLQTPDRTQAVLKAARLGLIRISG